MARRVGRIGRRDPISVAQRIASIGLTPIQSAVVTAVLETLAHAPAERASYVEMVRCWSLAGCTYPLFADSLARYKLTHGTGSLIEATVGDGGFDVRLESQGQLARYARKLQRSEGRVVFAGADHTDGWRGFIDGAIVSGGRAARAVVAQLA